MRDCGNRTKSMIEMWSRVKGDSLDAWVYIVIGITFGGGIVWYIYNKVQEHKRNARYKKNKKKNDKSKR
jgi:spermidine/putrescine transport system substrate-binding protein